VTVEESNPVQRPQPGGRLLEHPLRQMRESGPTPLKAKLVGVDDRIVRRHVQRPVEDHPKVIFRMTPGKTSPCQPIPEPPIWSIIVPGFTGLGLAGRRGRRSIAASRTMTSL
jgi:hypothetical protein